MPRAQVEALEGSQGPGQRPKEVVASDGSRVYDASAWSFVNPLPTSEVEQSFLFQSDNSTAFDFMIGAEPDPLVAAARDIADACPPDRVPRDSRQDDDGNVHELAIDCMVWWEIAKGTSSTTYDPASAVTRAQMASFVARLIEKSGGELPADAPTTRFTDDDGLEPHEANIDKLAAAGIVAGKGDGLYDPQGAVTRAQMAKFLVKGYEYRQRQRRSSRGGDYFADDDGSMHEANINKAATAGFTAGRDGGYEPGAPVLRDQMASFLARTLDLLVEEGTTPPKQ